MNDYTFQISGTHQDATCLGGCRGATHDALIGWFHMFGPSFRAMMTLDDSYPLVMHEITRGPGSWFSSG